MPGDEPIEIELLYFAALRELAGVARETLVLPPEVRSIGALRAWLEDARPLLRGRLANVRFAVGEDFAEHDHALVGGEVVALIPPVSGG